MIVFNEMRKFSQIAKTTANHKRTVLSIVDKLTTCECLDNGSSKNNITCEYKITVLSILCIFVR